MSGACGKLEGPSGGGGLPGPASGEGPSAGAEGGLGAHDPPEPPRRRGGGRAAATPAAAPGQGEQLCLVFRATSGHSFPVSSTLGRVLCRDCCPKASDKLRLETGTLFFDFIADTANSVPGAERAQLAIAAIQKCDFRSFGCDVKELPQHQFDLSQTVLTFLEDGKQFPAISDEASDDWQPQFYAPKQSKCRYFDA